MANPDNTLVVLTQMNFKPPYTSELAKKTGIKVSIGKFVSGPPAVEREYFEPMKSCLMLGIYRIDDSTERISVPSQGNEPRWLESLLYQLSSGVPIAPKSFFSTRSPKEIADDITKDFGGKFCSLGGEGYASIEFPKGPGEKLILDYLSKIDSSPDKS